jgi:hypothetical protein
MATRGSTTVSLRSVLRLQFMLIGGFSFLGLLFFCLFEHFL